MEMIYICSPLRGDINTNIRYTLEVSRRVALEGNIPIAPQIYYTRFLDDEDDKERNLIINYSIEQLKKCDKILVCGTIITDEMRMEIETAKTLNIAIEYEKENIV